MITARPVGRAFLKGEINMVWQLVGAAAGALAGGGINDIFNKASADRSYEINRRLQKHDQAFQREMRATAYQTTVEDMQKAGINPAVALSNGASQSQGGSSSASASAPSGGGENVAETIMSLKERKTGIDQIKANINNQTALTNADVELKTAQAVKTMKEAGYTQHQIDYYLANGYFPGQTITKSTNVSGPFGFAGGSSETVPATNKNNKELPKSAQDNWKGTNKKEQERIQRLRKMGWNG